MKWIVVQGLSRKSTPDLYAYGKQVAEMMAKSVWFPQPFPKNVVSLEELKQHLKDLSSALAAPDTGKRKTDAITHARITVEDDLRNLGYYYVTSVARRNPKNGAVIIHSAGMNYRVHGRRPAYTFKVKNHTEKGSVKATAEWGYRDSVYVWEYKRSNARQFTQAAKTMKASYIYKGLESATRYQFRVRRITPRRSADVMSQVLELVIL